MADANRDRLNQLLGRLFELATAEDGLEDENLVYTRIAEYYSDRLSVPPEWREALDVLAESQREKKDDRIFKPKDDEAFRLFLESDINF